MAATTSSSPTRALYITGIPKADALLNSNGTALLIGMLLDQQVPMEWAFTGPYTIKQRLGHCDASKIAAMKEDKFVSICCEKPAIHRFPASMAKRIHQMCVILTAEYKGKGSNVWKKIEDAEELRKRLRQLPGYGEEKLRSLSLYSAKHLEFAPPDGKRPLVCLAMPNHDRLPTFTHRHLYLKCAASSSCNGRKMLTNKTVPVVRVIA